MDKQQLNNIDEIIMSILFVAGQGVEIKEIAGKLNTTEDRKVKKRAKKNEKYGKRKPIMAWQK